MSGKSKEIETMLEKLSTRFAMTRSNATQENKCVTCGGDATKFNDAASEREYQISKMCQTCQDSVFG